MNLIEQIFWTSWLSGYLTLAFILFVVYAIVLSSKVTNVFKFLEEKKLLQQYYEYRTMQKQKNKKKILRIDWSK